jgi:hypothetical protein
VRQGEGEGGLHLDLLEKDERDPVKETAYLRGEEVGSLQGTMVMLVFQWMLEGNGIACQ